MAEPDKEALAERLVELYSDKLLRLAYSILNSVPDAQDVCQEVLLKRLEKRLEHPGAFENQEHEAAWLVRVTVNACKNLRRSPWRTRTVGLEQVAEPAAFQPEEGGVRRWRNPLRSSRRRAACWRRFRSCPQNTGRCWCSITTWATPPTRSPPC